MHAGAEAVRHLDGAKHTRRPRLRREIPGALVSARVNRAGNDLRARNIAVIHVDERRAHDCRPDPPRADEMRHLHIGQPVRLIRVHGGHPEGRHAGRIVEDRRWIPFDPVEGASHPLSTGTAANLKERHAGLTLPLRRRRVIVGAGVPRNGRLRGRSRCHHTGGKPDHPTRFQTVHPEAPSQRTESQSAAHHLSVPSAC
ncbi:MAG: hypothetical protein BWY06_03224 [Candidatus Latescibacteria bacterium ADurb.Bin168]|nr:MAG: hypothetical protein BWY06_03224 [Candidatus Latescibacteria bacterium ADurb.Bin168]